MNDKIVFKRVTVRNFILVYTKNNFEFHFGEFKIFIEKKLLGFGIADLLVYEKEDQIFVNIKTLKKN